MKSLLPVVKEEVGFSIAQYIGSRGDKEFIKKELRKIRKENPAVADFIVKWSKLDNHAIHSAFCGILVYQLLRSQAEVDRMEEDLFL
jgi:hypothetical protein